MKSGERPQNEICLSATKLAPSDPLTRGRTPIYVLNISFGRGMELLVSLELKSTHACFGRGKMGKMPPGVLLCCCGIIELIHEVGLPPLGVVEPHL